MSIKDASARQHLLATFTQKMTSLSQSPYSPDLATVDFFISRAQVPPQEKKNI